jgi:hypothetical protein
VYGIRHVGVNHRICRILILLIKYQSHFLMELYGLILILNIIIYNVRGIQIICKKIVNIWEILCNNLDFIICKLDLWLIVKIGVNILRKSAANFISLHFYGPKQKEVKPFVILLNLEDGRSQILNNLNRISQFVEFKSMFNIILNCDKLNERIYISRNMIIHNLNNFY